MRVGDLALPPVCHRITRARQIFPQHPFQHVSGRSLPWGNESSCPSPAATLGRAGPAPHLSSTVELTHLVKALVNQHENMSWRDLGPLLICRVVVWMMERCPHNLWHGEPGLRSWEQESCSYLSTAIALWGVVPVPCVCSRVRMALGVKMWVSQPWGCEPRTTSPAPCSLLYRVN